MSIRLACTDSGCGNRIVYGRKAGKHIIELRPQEMQTVTIDFCEGCDPCNASHLVCVPDVATPEPIVYAGGGLLADAVTWSECDVDILIDAENACEGEQYNVHVRAELENCNRLIETFRVKIVGC